MRTLIPTVVVCVLFMASCGDDSLLESSGTTPDVSDADSDAEVVSDPPMCPPPPRGGPKPTMSDAAQRPACGPTVDGRFTGWPECDGAAREYPGVATKGMYGDLYVRYSDGRLFVLNDWHVRDDAPVDPQMYNLFQLSCDLGQLEIRVYGDQTIAVELDGATFDGVSEGASGFVRTPRHDFPHAVFEFTLEIGDATCTWKQADPPPGSPGCGCSCPPGAVRNWLLDEPSTFVLVIVDGEVTLEIAEPGCAEMGEACEATSDCCVGVCTASGVCGVPTACGQPLEPCQEGSDCCSGFCGSGGQCDHEPPVCVQELEPCDGGEPCCEGACVDTAELGPVCTTGCGSSWDCAPDERCLLQGSPVGQCVDAFEQLCAPCFEHEDCDTFGTGALCLPYGDDGGKRCAVDCGELSCPGGFTCQSVASGGPPQCVPMAGVCEKWVP